MIYYTHKSIQDFTSTLRDISPVPHLSAEQVQEDYYLKDRVNGSVDLLFRFTDEAQAPALAFQEATVPPGSQAADDPLYLCVYLDPSLSGLWQAVSPWASELGTRVEYTNYSVSFDQGRGRWVVKNERGGSGR